MSQTVIPSMEFLHVQPQKLKALRVLACVEKICTTYQAQSLSTVSVSELETVLSDLIGITITVKLVNNHNNLSALTFYLHNAGGFGANKPLDKKTLSSFMRQGVIDYQTGKVSGFFASVPATLYIGSYFLSAEWGNPEQTTALILHEMGHLFGNFSTIGDYAILNYYLTEGTEVLLNQQSRKVTTEIYSVKYLEEHAEDKKIQKALATHPTQENVRMAIVDVFSQQRRSQLGSILGPDRRSEQLADWYAARLGFGRALAQALNRLDRQSHGRYYRTDWQFVQREALKVFLAGVGVTLNPLALMVFALLELWDKNAANSETYDTTRERIQKLRNEAVNQLKQVDADDDDYRQSLLSDISAIDRILKNLNEYSTVLESLLLVMNPIARNQYYRIKREEQLEQLLNNDLFVTAAQFQRLK